jgi:TetR/AcrR family transcriptional regulator, repressor for neighboring sulfatase
VNLSTRKRRTPDEAREEILIAAQDRLREFGLDGLNVVDVAKACGMSHATVLHHFGSTGGMRRELVAFMTAALIDDIVESLRQHPEIEPPQMLRSLFHTLATAGHTKLLAWLSLSGEPLAPQADNGVMLLQHFNALIPVIAERLPDSPQRLEHARRVVFLIATAAIGFVVGGPLLPAVIGLSEADTDAFPEWLGQQIYHLAST